MHVRVHADGHFDRSMAPTGYMPFLDRSVRTIDDLISTLQCAMQSICRADDEELRMMI
jgi:hypothetical protein